MSNKNVQSFKTHLSEQTTALEKKSSYWQAKLDKGPIDNEDAKGQILLAIGQAGLLIKERFAQFRGLIEDCEKDRSDAQNRKTTVDDLAGFWDMILIQIEDMNTKFTTIEGAEKNGWRFPEPAPPVRGSGDTAAISSKSSNGQASAEGRKSDHHPLVGGAVIEPTDQVKEEAEQSQTVKERRSELRNFIAQQKAEKQKEGGAGGGADDLFVDIKTV